MEAGAVRTLADAVVGSAYNCIMDVVEPGKAPHIPRPQARVKTRLNGYLSQVAKYL